MSSKYVSERRTEDLVIDLLSIQRWDTRRPPKGHLVRQNEYKSDPSLTLIFKGQSKSGTGDAYPDFCLIDRNAQPRLVIETKADRSRIDEALQEAEDHYGRACHAARRPVLACGVAGQEKSGIEIAVSKWNGREWVRIRYGNSLVNWIPTPDDCDRLLADKNLFDLFPVVPPEDVLAKKADLINRILRESKIKDEYRPAYVGAMMLALWRSRGQIRRDSRYVLGDINKDCGEAFQAAGKVALGKSLRVDEANKKLAASAWQILAELEKLNVSNASFSHDYLGALYELFFRYTGGNTIGQYFTPRHITRFMADLVEFQPTDTAIDPACGTGGFLVACIQRIFDLSGQPYHDVIDAVKNRLVGFESEPVTAALCVANMILRGDGKTGVHQGDCFSHPNYPTSGCDIALMNPPFPHKKTDAPPQAFIDRAMESLRVRGKLAVIVPSSMLAKASTAKWRRELLKDNRLVAVCQLPDELFQPYASATTSVLVIEKGVPHSKSQTTTFVRVVNDGFELRKGVRVSREHFVDELPEAIDAILNRRTKPGFSGAVRMAVEDEWSPGSHIPSAVPAASDILSGVDDLIRKLASFYARYAPQIVNQRRAISEGRLEQRDYRSTLTRDRIRNSENLRGSSDSISSTYDIYYGLRELHSRDGFARGDALIISPTEMYNGCYGWLDFPFVSSAPFITVAQTGSIGEAFVQMEPCAVNDDCLILIPRVGRKISLAEMFVAASILRQERWRFSYGRKLTPQRIAGVRLSYDDRVISEAKVRIKKWTPVFDSILSIY